MKKIKFNIIINDNKTLDYINNKIESQIVPKMDVFLDLSHEIQSKYGNYEEYLPPEEEKKLWKAIEALISKEEHILWLTEFIAELKQEMQKRGTMHPRLEVELTNLINQLNSGITLAKIIDSWFQQKGIH